MWEVFHPFLEQMGTNFAVETERAMEQLINFCKETKKESEGYDSFLRTARLGGRTFGKTTKNRIYNAVNEARTGDAVFALAGSPQHLWTLRPAADNSYKLVGAIHVDGYMQGELYDGVDPDEVDYEVRIS
jgi:hypothetical protein